MLTPDGTDDDVTLDRSHDYLDEQANRNSVTLSSGNAGLTMDPSPYKTLSKVYFHRPPRGDRNWQCTWLITYAL